MLRHQKVELHDGDAGNTWRGLGNAMGMNEKVKDGRLPVHVPHSKFGGERSECDTRYDVPENRIKGETVDEDLNTQACPILAIWDSDVK